MPELAMDPDLAVRLQRYAWAAAAASYQAVSCPPFTAFFSPHDPAPHRNYAVPGTAPEAAPRLPAPSMAEAIAHVTSIYRAQSLLPRFELIPDANPGLVDALEAGGYRLDEHTLVMCHMDPAPQLSHDPQLEIVVVDATAPDRDLADAHRVQACAFGGLEALPLWSDESTHAARAALGGTRFVLVRRGGAPVCAAGIMPAHDGIAEVTGVATVPWERRRGLGTTITRVALAVARREAPLCFLTAADAAAGRIYARVGFRAVGEACACSQP